jgi:hypothetical protein
MFMYVKYCQMNLQPGFIYSTPHLPLDLILFFPFIAIEYLHKQREILL